MRILTDAEIAALDTEAVQDYRDSLTQEAERVTRALWERFKTTELETLIHKGPHNHDTFKSSCKPGCPRH